MAKPLDRADGRPRVHIWPHRDFDGVQWTFGPSATPHQAIDAGDALNSALGQLATRAEAGVVVIVEPPI